MPSRDAASSPARQPPEYSPQMHREMVAVAAYYRAERRGFTPGDPTADWLEAEAEIQRQANQAPAPVDSHKPGAKHAFLHKFESHLEQWDAKLDRLRVKTKHAKADVRTEFEVQLEALTGKRALAQEKLHELRQHGEWAWEDLKDGADKAWKELREALEHAASRLK